MTEDTNDGQGRRTDPLRLAANATRREVFSRNLRRHFLKTGWNQAELGRRASEFMPEGRIIGKQSITAFMKGVNMPQPQALLALAKALGCDPADLDPSNEGRWIAQEGRSVMAEMKSSDARAPQAEPAVGPQPMLVVDEVDGLATVNIRARLPLDAAMQIFQILREHKTDAS